MADGKNIKFTFEVDQQSFSRVKTAIKDITDDLKRMNTALGGVNIGGAAPSAERTKANVNSKTGAGGGGTSGGQNQTIGKVLLDNVKAFKDFAAQGKEASKIMTDSLKRDIGEQQRTLDGLQKTIKELGSAYKDLESQQKRALSSGNMDAVKYLKEEMANVEGQIAGTSGDMVKGHKNLKGSQALLAETGGGGGRFGNFMRGIGYSGSGFGGGAMGMLGGIGTLAGGMLYAGAVGVKEYMAGTRSYGAAEASRGKMTGGEIRAMRSGDLSTIQAMRMIGRDPQKRAELAAQYGTAANIEAGLAGLGEFGADLAGKLTFGLSNALAGRKAGGALGSSLTTASQQDRLMQNAKNYIDDQKNSGEILQTALATEYFQNTMPNRMNSARLRGLRIGTKPGGSEVLDNWGLEDKRLTQMGGSVAEKDAAYASLLGMGGRTLARSAESQMFAQQAGYGGYGSALQSLALASRGNMDWAKMTLGMAAGNGMDRTAALGLAGVVGGYDPGRGAVDPMDIVAGFARGVGGSGNSIQDMMNVEALKGGLAFGSKFTSGSLDPYQKGKNTVAASIALGSGASTYAVDYMAGLDFTKLAAGMGGSIDRTATNMGLGQDEFSRVGNKIFGGMFDNYYRQGKNDKIADAVDKFKASGKDLKSYLSSASEEEKGLLADAMSLGSAGGMEADTSLTLLKTMGGMAGNKNLKTGGFGGGKLDKETQAALDHAADVKGQDAAKVGSMGQSGELVKDFESLGKATRKLADFGSNLSAQTGDFIKALSEMTSAIKKSTPGNEGFNKGTPKK